MPGNPFARKRLLIVKLDAIGDYILFRNTVSVIKRCDRFKHHSFTLLGNRAFKDLALTFDTSVFDSFIWVDPHIVYGIGHYSRATFGLLLSLKLKGFDIVIHPTHSRLVSTDLFIKYIGAKKMIASAGDTINYPAGDKLPTGSGTFLRHV
jgi:ADP-heptose:LPS heptosyltransferase